VAVEHLEILVEEPSMEALLRVLLPKFLHRGIEFRVRVFNGKQDLLSQLPQRLSGYHEWLPDSWRIIVLVDRDQDDCHKLKKQLEDIAADARLSTKSSVPHTEWPVVNRLAIEELEAWLFGDMDAVRAAYPRVPRTIEERARYRHPDAIRGGTGEALERVLKSVNYFSGGLRKLEAARKIALHMNPEQNRSHSFQVFRNTIDELARL